MDREVRDRRGGIKVAVEGPDGQIHGGGNVIASAHADQWRPADFPPHLRQLLFGAPTDHAVVVEQSRHGQRRR